MVHRAKKREGGEGKKMEPLDVSVLVDILFHCSRRSRPLGGKGRGNMELKTDHEKEKKKEGEKRASCFLWVVALVASKEGRRGEGKGGQEKRASWGRGGEEKREGKRGEVCVLKPSDQLYQLSQKGIRKRGNVRESCRGV